MEKKSIDTIAPSKLNNWRIKSWQHNLNKKYIAEQCFSNYRTIHNAMVLGLASKKTQSMLDTFFKSL